MRFSVNRELLCETVMNLSRAVSVKSTIPVLEGIHMTAASDGLKMIAYNLEIGMTKTIDINCAEEGTVVIKAKLLGEILKSIQGDIIYFEVNDRLVCKIKSGSTMFDIMGMSASEFPEIPSIENCEKVVLPSDVLKDMVRQTVFSTAPPDSDKQLLTGLLFDLEEDSIKVVGVDGYRLALRKQKLNVGKKLEFVISAKTIGEAVKIIKEENEEIEFFVGDRHIGISVDGYNIISRKIVGEFIDYKKIMPSSFSTSVNINTKEISSIIERISLIIDDQLKTPMRCKLNGDEIIFTCSTSLGRATDSYKSNIDGDSFELGINNRFLQDALKATDCENAIMKFNGPFSSFLILPTDGDDFIYMIMPMRLKSESDI